MNSVSIWSCFVARPIVEAFRGLEGTMTQRIGLLDNWLVR